MQENKKKVSFDFAIALCFIGAPDIPKILLGDPGWRTWLFSHTHLYRGKIDRFCLRWF